MTVGLVVAGGFSMRFGIAEKALVEVGGETMLSRIVGTLERTVDDVVIDCRAEQVEPFRTALSAAEAVDGSPTFAVGNEPDAGPVAGLANGLSTIEARETIDDETAIVVSCDRPGITPALLEHLGACRRRYGVEAALPVVDGFLQPLCGVYRIDALAESVRTARDSDVRRLISIPRSLSRHRVTERALADVVDPAALASVDTPLDAAMYTPVKSRTNVEPAARDADPVTPISPIVGD